MTNTERMDTTLLEKYDQPVPRYTSYPTVPYWNSVAPSERIWTERFQEAFATDRGISLYIHLPFCENLCTYCGCNKRITRNHAVEGPYVDSLLAEWKLYLDKLPGKPIIRELHLGGGTPTFFSPENLKRLITGILNGTAPTSRREFSFEAHPNSTTFEHLQLLRNMGFDRISIGVQDIDPTILRIINRRQTMEDVTRCVKDARTLGYRSVNFDLIFGLPLQTPDHIRRNMDMVKKLRPDRIAFYGYAHVPWKSPGQRAYSEKDLPTGAAKRKLYELGREELEAAGYTEIGLDHFALPHDSLTQAHKEGNLHRNFMGYTAQHTRLCIGLGASAISDSWNAFVQNEKKVEDYQARVQAGELPIIKGHLLSPEDQIIRYHILNLMCRQETTWYEDELRCDALYDAMDRWQELEADGLIARKPFQLKILPQGRPFLRNICLALDARYWRNRPQQMVFSSGV